MEAKKLWTVKEAAEILGVTTGRIRQICRESDIGVILGHDRLLTKSDLKILKDRPDRRRRGSEKKSRNGS